MDDSFNSADYVFDTDDPDDEEGGLGISLGHDGNPFDYWDPSEGAYPFLLQSKEEGDTKLTSLAQAAEATATQLLVGSLPAAVALFLKEGDEDDLKNERFDLPFREKLVRVVAESFCLSGLDALSDDQQKAIMSDFDEMISIYMTVQAPDKTIGDSVLEQVRSRPPEGVSQSRSSRLRKDASPSTGVELSDLREAFVSFVDLFRSLGNTVDVLPDHGAGTGDTHPSRTLKGAVRYWQETLKHRIESDEDYKTYRGRTQGSEQNDTVASRLLAAGDAYFGAKCPAEEEWSWADQTYQGVAAQLLSRAMVSPGSGESISLGFDQVQYWSDKGEIDEPFTKKLKEHLMILLAQPPEEPDPSVSCDNREVEPAIFLNDIRKLCGAGDEEAGH